MPCSSAGHGATVGKDMGISTVPGPPSSLGQVTAGEVSDVASGSRLEQRHLVPGADETARSPASLSARRQLFDADAGSSASPALEDGRVATLRRKLLAEGVEPVAVETIVQHRWARTSAKGMDSVWAQWVKFCRSRNLGAQRCEDPQPVDVVNFLEAARLGEFRKDPQAGRGQHTLR